VKESHFVLKRDDMIKMGLFQVRRKWNNMKKMTRKKWESFDRDADKRDDPDSNEPSDNSATFEITRKEVDIDGKTSTTIVVVNVVSKKSNGGLQQYFSTL
jgi:hypothetical protein